MTDDGRLAVTKRAPAGPGAERLRREADVLHRATHPGVVELLGFGEAHGEAVLHTAFVGGKTLAEHLGPLDAPTSTTTTTTTKAPGGSGESRVAADLATTVADLHDRGIVHRRITADHVLVTDGDRARLCGFAEAAVSSDALACDAEVAAADVEAVATLARELAGRAAGADAAALRAVADRVLLADPSARPSMRTLAQALVALTDGAGMPDLPGAQGRRILAARPTAAPRRLRPTPGRVATAVAGVAAVLTVPVVLAILTTGPGPPAGPVAAPPPSLIPPDTTPPTTAPLAVRVWPSEPEPEPTAGTRPAAEAVEVVKVADGVVSSSGQRWHVAAPDDLVVVGDWDCDGIATPAVVRHGTGHVWTYATWAEGTEGVVADPAGRVPGAVSATAVAVNGCHHLEVVDTTGKTTRLGP